MFFHAMQSESKNYVPQISPQPLFVVVSLKDCLIDSQVQLDAVNNAGEPKELVELLKSDCGHFEVYRGRYFEENAAAFLQQCLQSTIHLVGSEEVSICRNT
ncbi:alpha/beta-hydrolase [Penicillium sp. IBT 18751x]|nr:alpha/beta-hydrolase [Penicillium sp. IBT 18751x]